jgi:hypothetical protein
MIAPVSKDDVEGVVRLVQQHDAVGSLNDFYGHTSAKADSSLAVCEGIPGGSTWEYLGLRLELS